ncbi:MAG TPA: MFS transporter [Ferruginibacter sp.]|nr:MFS transporter [Ferruginibacter sp.]
MDNKSSQVLPVIVIAQFLCTSLWFAGNAVLPDLVKNFELSEKALGHITSAVQFGFISGTLLYAALTIADRFSPSAVFFTSSILAAFSNLGITLMGPDLNSLLLLRFLTGFFLAGIYPVGMKIAADHFDTGLGKALGFLVGALVAGTAFPHLLKSFTAELPWKTVLFFTSASSVLGGLLMFLLVPNGPYRKKNQALNFNSSLNIFKNGPFRSAALGYFGHMWELYAFWAFVPVMLSTYKHMHPHENINVPLLTFFIIALGGIACVISGYLSQRYGAAKTASAALFLSGCCCVLSPLAFYLPFIFFVAFLIFWGLVVIADSPMFSTLVAQNAPVQVKGTALTLVTCIGFSITIISIELLNYLSGNMNTQFMYLILGAGPLFGLLYMFMSKQRAGQG